MRLIDNAYDPTSLEIPPGNPVSFTNEGTRDHTVTVHKVGDPQSEVHEWVLQPGQPFVQAFKLGTFNVWCRFHGTEGSGMSMTITVAE